MQRITVTGASGFAGSRFVQLLAGRSQAQICGLIRHGSPPHVTDPSRLTIVRGALTDPSVMAKVLQPGCMVANFAYDGSASQSENLAATTALADACCRHGIKRMVHCSTAMVTGKTVVAQVDEATECRPGTDYERSKLAIENLLRDKARGHFELVILRPTAMFGPGGRNLLKMAHDLTHNLRLTNYLRSCANDHRRLHLVCLDNAVAAAAFMLEAPGPIPHETYIVADDEAPENNFRDVEQFLMHALHIRDYRMPRAPLPSPFLSWLLRLRGRSLVRADTVFNSKKLTDAGFRKPVEFASGLKIFADWYKQRTANEGCRI
jgi:nucleoside-diphosphate-sugar epimerase